MKTIMVALVFSGIFCLIPVSAQQLQMAKRPKEELKERFDDLKLKYKFEEWAGKTEDNVFLASTGALPGRFEKAIGLPLKMRAGSDEKLVGYYVEREAGLCRGDFQVLLRESVLDAHEGILEDMLLRSKEPQDVMAKQGGQYHVGDVAFYILITVNNVEQMAAVTFARGNVLVKIRDYIEPDCRRFDVLELARLIDEAILEEARNQVDQR